MLRRRHGRRQLGNLGRSRANGRGRESNHSGSHQVSRGMLRQATTHPSPMEGLCLHTLVNVSFFFLQPPQLLTPLRPKWRGRFRRTILQQISNVALPQTERAALAKPELGRFGPRQILNSRSFLRSNAPNILRSQAWFSETLRSVCWLDPWISVAAK
jgi:hypothetical protein